MHVLLTGSTGFVGGRLHDPLVAAGHQVRCGVRDPAREAKAHPQRSCCKLDLDDPETLEPALQGMEAAFYLVHGMAGAPRGYAEREQRSAARFALAAARAGLRRIVYLGGVAPPDRGGSTHLGSRLEVGRVLRDGPVPCLELRASMIVGHGSASFRILRDLAARLPVMLFPGWLENRTEPVAIDDVVGALLAALRVPLPESEWTDLPGPELLRVREMILRTAALLGVRPRTLGIPLLTPRLSARWLWLISGVDYRLARELVDGLRTDLVAERRGFRVLAGLPPALGFDEAVRRALEGERAAGDQGTATQLWERLVQAITP